MSALVMRRPDDWHLHLRDGAALHAVLPFTAARFARAMVMPNLTPPVTTTEAALAYRGRILAALPPGVQFEPLMTLYLTDTTPAAEVERARASGCVLGCKLYPAGATTHAEAGVTDVRRIDAVLARMAELGMVLQVHGEVTDPAVDVFDREASFIDAVLAPLTERHRQLRIVFEHITTRDAVNFVLSGRSGIAATVTPQHLLMNRNALFAGGLRPHTTACRCSRRSPTVRRCSAPWRAAARGCFSAPTARRTRATPRKRRAAAPVSSAHTPASSCTPRPSSRWARSSASRPSPPATAP